MSSLLRSSKFVRHFISLARNVVTSNRPDIDGSLLQRSQNLVGVCCSNFSSSLIQMRGAQTSLDHNVRRLDEDARRSGRIAMKEIEETLNEIRRLKKASTSQSLMVIRCCGNLVPEESPERRTQLVEEIWTTLENLGVSLDISHYNALLKVYLENEHQFSPTEFLAKLEQRGIEPNRVTYQRLVSGYCQKGDIAGATKILEYMKEKQIPVSEGVFNALILGHSQADDMKSAEGILSVMKQANLEPSNETYTVLLSGFARLGDKEAVLRLITECKLKDVLLSDRDILEIAYAAAVNDHDQLVDEVLANVRNMVGYNQDAVNTLLRLITKGKDEAAYKVFMTMQSPVKSDNGLNMSGHLLIKQLVKMNRPADNILNFSERLKKDGHTSHGLSLAIETSFYHGNVDLTLGLLRALKKNGEPVRCHYFWPSLVVAGKSGNFNGLNAVLRTMVEEFGVVVNAETVRDYYLPYCGNKPTDDKLRALVENGVRRAQAVKALLAQLINQNNLKDAINLGLQHGKINLRSLFMSRQEKWKGKVAVVTGASSGIGAAIARALVHHGLSVVGLARREDRMKKLSEELSNEMGKLIPIKTDLRKEDEILAAFCRIESEFGGSSILVNNSGVTDTEKFTDGITEKWREMLEVNVLALCICSKAFLQSATKNNLEHGHIININSVLGHVVNSGRSAVYQASKHAVTALCKSLRKGLADEGSTIKVTSISPGFTRSELVKGTKTEELIHSLPILEAKDVAEAVVSVLSTSDIAQVCEMVVTPVPSKKLLY